MFAAIPWYSIDKTYLAKGTVANKQCYFMLTDAAKFWCVIDDLKEIEAKRKKYNSLLQTDSEQAFHQLLSDTLSAKTNCTYIITKPNDLMATIKISKLMAMYEFVWELTLYEIKEDGMCKHFLVNPLIKIINSLEKLKVDKGTKDEDDMLVANELQTQCYSLSELPKEELKRKHKDNIEAKKLSKEEPN